MGLDMYLTKKIYIGAYYEHRNITGDINLYEDGTPIKINLKKIESIVEQVCTWRKANHIHKWFVDNCQNGEDDCREAFTTNKQLKELLELCKKVLMDKSLASTLLPVESGFFFGSDEYDEYYFNELEYTIKIISPILTDSEDTFYYQSSW